MWRCCGRKIDTQFNFTLNLASRQSNHICDKDAIEIYAQRQLNKENKLTRRQGDWNGEGEEGNAIQFKV